MSFNFSKSKFVSTYTTCNKYAWLDKYKKEEKTAYSDFRKYLFEIGHVVGDLAKKYFNIDADATVLKEDGSPNNAIHKAKQLEGEALEKYKRDLIEYCALDTYAIVKVLKKLYEAI